MFAPFKEKYMALTPKQKTMLLIGGVPSVILIAVLIFSPEKEIKPVPTSNQSETGIFDTNSKEMTVPALSIEVNGLKKQFELMAQRQSASSSSTKRILDTLETMSDGDSAVRSFYEINRRLSQMEAEIAKVRSMPNERQVEDSPSTIILPVDEKGDDTLTELENDTDINKPTGEFIADERDEDPIDYSVTKKDIPSDPLEFVNQANDRAAVKQETDSNVFINEDEQRSPPRNVVSTVISVDEVAKSEVNKSDVRPAYKGKRVLAGAVIPFTLINGFDAPTGKANSSDPVSATVRITGPALLPNGYKVDLTGCLVTNLVKGNEATERASLRPDRLTCKYSYGEVDIAIQGYISGKDGSAGLRGRLVSKQQRALLYGSIAGVAQGLGNAFGGGSRGSIGSLGGDPFALPSSDQALRSSATSGLSQGSEFLTDYYEKKLDSLYDIIEIKPLVKGTIHVLTSFELKLLDEPSTTSSTGGK